MQTIVTQYQDQLVDVARQYGVSYLALFGSHARGDASTHSDIDLMVDYDQPLGLFKFAKLQQQLTDLLGQKVDLVSRKGVSKYLKPFIENDLYVVYEKN